MSDIIKNEINQLNLLLSNTHFIMRWFFPKSLARALNDYQTSEFPVSKKIWNIYAAVDKALSKKNIIITPFYESHTTLMVDFFREAAKQKLFFTWEDWEQAITHQELRALASACSMLSKTPLFIGDKRTENFQTLMRHPAPFRLASIISKLDMCHLLDDKMGQKNWEQVIKHKKPEELDLELSRIIHVLNGKEAQENFQLLIEHENPIEMKAALYQLDQRGLLCSEDSKQNRIMIAQHPNAHEVAMALGLLDKYELLAEKDADIIRKSIRNHSNPIELAEAICLFHKSALLKEKNSNVIQQAANHSNPLELAQAICLLYKFDLLKEKDLDLIQKAVANHSNPIQLAQAICLLYKFDLLKGKDSNVIPKVTQSPNPLDEVKRLKSLKKQLEMEENITKITPYASLFFKPKSSIGVRHSTLEEKRHRIIY